MRSNSHFAVNEQVVIAATGTETLISAIALSLNVNSTLDVHTCVGTHVHDEVVHLGSASLCIAVLHQVELAIIHVGITSYNQLAVVVECSILCAESQRTGSIVACVDPIDILLRYIGLASDSHLTVVEEVAGAVQCHLRSGQLCIVTQVHEVRTVAIGRRIG